MHIYFEKEFFNEFIDLELENKFVVDFSDEFLEKSLEYELFTNFEEDDFHNLLRSNPYAQFIVDGLEGITYGCSIDNFIINKDTVHKILLVNNFDDKKRWKTGYEYISSANLIDKWQIYTIKRDDLNLPTTLNENRPIDLRFSSWDDLSRHKHPINDICIYDHYILNDGYSERINDNLIPLLISLNKMSDNKKNIKLMCFDNQLMPFDLERSINEKIGYIKKLIKDEVGDCDVEIIIEPSRGDQRQHDRYIMTNLFIIERGKGFNIFDPEGNINDISRINFFFNFFLRNISLLKELREKIERIEDLSNMYSINN
tara:strand:+ start:27 stop:968 length:942 start_codon:yes stop_codon:yes gene_type:complete